MSLICDANICVHARGLNIRKRKELRREAISSCFITLKAFGFTS